MSVTLEPVDTATVSLRAPDTVATGPLSATARQDRAYLRFELPDDYDPTVPASAQLELTVQYSTATEEGVAVFPETNEWDASSLTYENRPLEDGLRMNQTAPIAVSGTRLTIDLPDVAPAVVGDSLSLRMEYLESFISSTYVREGDGAPSLTMTYTPADTVRAEPGDAAVAGAPDQSASAVRAAPSERKVFAHYFPPYPVSIDNKPAASDYYTRNYLAVGGENGKHAAYGGLLRDRPVAVTPSTSSGWKVENLQREVRQAKAAGIDGFTVNIMSLSGSNWDATVNLMTAAQREGGFSIVPMIDVKASAGRSAAAAVADKLATLYKSPSAFRVGNDYLLSSFAAESQSVSWWRAIIDRLEKTHGVPITFQAVFLSASDANMKAFAPIADGFGNWGVRTQWHTANGPDYAARAAALGKTWMAPVSVQDYRPRAGVYAESSNTANLRASWESAISKNAVYVQLVTWNDYSENTHFAPSVDHGDTFLDISRYYADWFHTRARPAVTADEAFLTHRTQFVGAKPTILHKLALPTLGGTSSVKPTDNVEALVFLKTPATVTITVGGVARSFSAPAGVSAFTVPLKVGSASVKITRGTTTVLQLTSPHAIVSSPKVQDLGYHGATSVK
ncbi:glycoside hydrolase family 71 protein [Microbacterium sp. zg.Y909]|uniref:glycoside hydrolase family 71 protein n=1 Tax=Microbacterium sp. zg.Y909 TaxID=2969413 RepID=UPI00214BA416|nr:glycoside hydrolase family 71 protein [Microbacterium sp. zg.Y909]MCR2823971.1 glycoside hydrolase family 71 protein [Microbacterium sp. zg.Y909]